ncbi:hypothetical protein Glove_239g8 [Diversispora epigaea]|uniref:ribonuclease H n=2 Tax=Diversispora epigaea TaxID=1348612 RepID=A0A397II69_9GLOM|nr:hypothetical protein Glove_239g8 [Diversispora epigaea]
MYYPYYSHGNTLAYNVKDGIDQGDIISPLFWRIFYDPLVHRIAESKLGYTMKEKWISNLHSQSKKRLSVHASVAAYVDDTNWIAPNKRNMEEILTIANEFYQMNDITINKSKSYLIAINVNSQTKLEGLLMGDETLYPVAKDYPVRSLGVYITENGSKQFQKDRLKKLTNYMANILKGKPITDKQAIYIFNAVVIPMLEYSLNDMTLSEKECLKITTKFISMIKNKALLPITAPNALIHAKEAYDVCHLWDRQLQMQSNNLFNRLNDKGMLGCSTRVRLQHLQNSFWSGQSITESLFTMKTKRGRSLLNDILVICKIHDLTFKLSKNLNDNLLIKGGNITIEELLDDESQYRLIRKSLRNRQLMFLEQLVSHNGKILLHWQEITNNDRRSPKPGWFKTLENKLLTDTKTRVLSAEMQTTLDERYNICNWNIGKQSNSINWVAIQNDEGTHPLIGKKRKMFNKDEFTIQHHTKEVSSQSSGNSILEKCTGCAQGDRSLVANLKNQNVCLIKTSMAKSVSINVVRSVVSLRSTPDRSNRLRLRSSQNAIRDGISKIIEDSLPVGSIRSIDPPTVYISNNARDRTTMIAKFQNFWTQENIQTKLDDIRLKLSSSTSIRIYTDGSLIKKDNNNSHITTMGCGWCAFDENDTEFNFSGKVENFTSSTRAELMAILTAVYATPKRSRLCIFTDSQAAIDAIANAATNPRKAHRKLKNWTIVKAIEEIANVQNLTLRLEKVKAHSGVIHNETADKLAREGCLKPVCSPDLQSLTSVNAVSCWNTETIEEPLRHFTKKLGKAKHSIKWRLLNRNISTISAFKSKQIQWESSWRTTMLSYVDRNVTDNKETRQRAFNVKLFNNELPTLEKLKDRFPKIYENDSCIRCNLEKENQVHVLTCPKNLIDIHSCRNKLINLLVSKTTTVACGDTCKNMCKTLEALNELHIPRDVSTRDADHLSFIDVMLGLIPITVYDIVLQKVVTHELADQIIDDVFVQFKLFLHTHIWKDRCTAVKKWETENGISNNKWKKKIRNETRDTIVTSQINNTDDNSVFNNNTQGVTNIINKNNHNYNRSKISFLFSLNRFIYNHIIKDSCNWTWLYKIGCSAGP